MVSLVGVAAQHVFFGSLLTVCLTSFGDWKLDVDMITTPEYARINYVNS